MRLARIVLFLLAVCLGETSVSAALICYDNFDAYTNGPVVGNSGVSQWINHSGLTSDSLVVNQSLQISQSNFEDIHALLANQPYATNSGSVLYASFNVRFTKLPSETGNYFAHFMETAFIFRCRIWASTSNSASGYFRLGISQGNVSPTQLPIDLQTNITYRVVVRHEVSTPMSTLWLNPSLESGFCVASTNEPSLGPIQIVAFAFRQASREGILLVDDLRIGTSFYDVLGSGALLPLIIQQPASRMAQVGDTVSFQVSSSSPTPLNFQWRHNGQDIPGATSAALTLNTVTFFDAGTYSVRVWNSLGSLVSSTAQLTVTSAVSVFQTNLTPSVSATTPATSFPTIPSQLEVFEFGSFTPNPTFLPINTNRMTIVLTHGWNSSPSEWGTNMAKTILVASNSIPLPNIVAWNWQTAATSSVTKLEEIAGRTSTQGKGLGQALAQKLGPNYSQPIHFMGHSLGTLVNAHAADYLHTNGFSSANTHITLFDEAEAGTDFGKIKLLQTIVRKFDPLAKQPYYDHPLPQQSAWVDNYVSLVGLLHPEARNVVLTNGLPGNAASFSAWFDTAVNFHSYPQRWYSNSVTNPNATAMGYRWSFEKGGFSGSPAANTAYLQSGSEMNLILTNYTNADALLSERIQKYFGGAVKSGFQSINNLLTANGQVTGESLTTGLPTGAWNLIINLFTSSSGGSSLMKSLVSGSPGPMNIEGSGIPAYVWATGTIPTNATSMTFDFVLQGNPQSDSFAVAVNGTNVLSVTGSLIQTNIILNSGPIDVSKYSGQQVELFLGIVGSTSTNASVTASNFQFYTFLPPSLQAQVSSNGFVVSWPLPASDYVLQSTTNVLATNSWTTTTNVPAVVDFQNTVTNPTSGGNRFYRLKK